MMQSLSSCLTPTRMQKAIGHYRNLLFPTLHSMYFNLILHQLDQPWRQCYPPISYFEFGVGWGGTLSSYMAALRRVVGKKGMSKYPLILFDTFEGLPESKDSGDLSPWWHPGAFSHSVSYIKSLLARNGVDTDGENLRFVQGEYGVSLTPLLRESLANTPPSIVTVDVDYYTSTKTLLEWIEPLLHDGTVFYFDDIDSFYGNPNYGELRAINEFNKLGKGYLRGLNYRLPAVYSARVYVYSKQKFGDGWFRN